MSGENGDQPTVTADDAPMADAPVDLRPEALAAVGLSHKHLTTEERAKFRGKAGDYQALRDEMVVKWYANPGTALTLQDALAGVPAGRHALVRRVHAFLQEHGYINFGAAAEPPPRETAASDAQPADATAAAAAEGGAEGANGDAAPAEPELSPEAAAQKALLFRLYDILRAADLGSLSAKMIRGQLENEFGRDLKEQMPVLRQHIDYFVEHVDEKDTLIPMGYEPKAVSDRPASSSALHSSSGVDFFVDMWRELARKGSSTIANRSQNSVHRGVQPCWFSRQQFPAVRSS